MNYTILSFVVLAITTLLRLLIIGRIGLGDDEAHYWAYSQHPDLSYFDHPPVIGYLIKFSTSIFGANEFAVRLPAVLLFVLVSIFIFQLARKLYGDKIAFWSVALLQVTPVFSFLGAVLTVPDAPLAACWMAFIYFFWKAMHIPTGTCLDDVAPTERRNGEGWYWFATGITLGIGLLSKYNAVLLPASAFFFLLVSPRHRYWLKRGEPYLALIIAGIIFIPVLLWNMENNWASFGFQLHHGFGKTVPKFSPALLGRSLGAQAGYISPFLFISNWAVLGWLARQSFKERDEKALFLFAFSFPTLLLFNGVASFNEILPHWPATGYLVLTIAVAWATVTMWDKKSVRVGAYVSWSVGFLLTVLVPLQAVYKILPPERFLPKAEAVKIEDGVTKAEKVDVTNELYGWPVAGKAIAEIIAKSPDPKPFIFTHRHYIASQLSFYVPGHPRIYCFSDRIDAYDFWQRNVQNLQGRDGIFVTDNRFYTEPEKVYPFQSWQKLPSVTAYRKGRKIRVFSLTRGTNFNVQALSPEYTADVLGKRLSWKEALKNFDCTFFFMINKDRHIVPLDYFMRLCTFIGYGVPLVILVGVILWFTRRERFWPEFLFAASIIIFGGALVQIIKGIVARVRPLTVFDDQVRVLGERLYRCSFPSGHSQSAFSAATFLTTKVKKYGWLFFMVAFLIAISRVYVGAHFPLDIIAGSIIGVVTTWIAVKYIKI